MTAVALAGQARIYLTRDDLAVMDLAYPDGAQQRWPGWRYLLPRVGRAHAATLRKWAEWNPAHELSTVALMLAGDLEALEVNP